MNENKTNINWLIGNYATYHVADAIRITSILLSSFMPETFLKVFKSLNTNNNTYDKVATGNMESNIKLGESEVLFKRIEEKK